MSTLDAPIDRRQPRIRLRFSLQTLVFLVAYVSLLCAWGFWLPFPWWFYLHTPGLLGVLSVSTIACSGLWPSYIGARSTVDVLICGCLLTGINVVLGYLEPQGYFCRPTMWMMAEAIHLTVYKAAVGRTALPLFVLMPVVYYGILTRTWHTSHATRWFVLAMLVVLLDLILCGFGFVMAFDWAAGL